MFGHKESSYRLKAKEVALIHSWAPDSKETQLNQVIIDGVCTFLMKWGGKNESCLASLDPTISHSSG